MNDTGIQRDGDAATGNGLRRVAGSVRRGLAASGFTLIELIIALAILSIMITAVVPIARNLERQQKEKELRANLRMIRQAIDRYKRFCDTVGISQFEKKQDDYCYPQSLEVLVDGIAPAAPLQVPGMGLPNTDPNSTSKVDQKIRFLNRIPKDPMTPSGEWGLRSFQDEKDAKGWGGQNIFDVYSKSEQVGLNGKKYNEW
ncbi:MAG TPA: type II secretion system protein [Blastocatellia bacterium]|nr:type II secretion system protein [Blastocatellia bacterium]